MTPTIRPYDASDRAACQHVFYRSVREGAAAFYDADQRAAWAPTDTPDPAIPDKLLNQWAWVAETDAGVIGFMSLDNSGYLDVAFVLPEAKGQGVADALYDSLLNQAKTAGFKALTVHASHLARRFFIKHGWQVEQTEQHPANGQVFERFVMSLNLQEFAT
jgi:putative acetyltransferase